MKKDLFSTIILSTFLFSNVLIAQNVIPCFTDEMTTFRKAQNPAVLEAEAEYDRVIKRGNENQGAQKSSAVRTIPVVFHVIHENGAENISKSQIEDGLRILNEDFRKLNPDIVTVNPIFAGITADCELNFKLAKKDPNGNCTDGIVRVYSKLTNNADDDVKPLSRWSNTKYLNIWVVKTIDSQSSGSSGGIILGYAYLPSVVNWGPNIDGILIRSDRVGAIGTAASNGGRTLTHEVGHYLGLNHTFNNGCSGGDNVSDTPPVAAANYGCVQGTNTCHNDNPDLVDQIENHMDYTSCRRMFSNGQKTIINTAISNYRSTLVSSSNLIATGVNTNATCIPIVEFTSDYLMVCTGTSVKYTDVSWRGTPTSWNWTFEGGSPASSNTSSPSVVYNTPGVFNVSLTAGNSVGNDTKAKQKYIRVSDPAQSLNNNKYWDDFEDLNFVNENWTVINQDNGNTWEYSEGTGVWFSKCMRMKNQTGNTVGEVDKLISPAYNLTSVATPALRFNIAYAQKSSASSDQLRILASTNCGRSWTVRWTKSGADLASAPIQSGVFIPNTMDQWKEITVPLTSALTMSSNVRFMFEFTSGGGNHLYMDNINIADPLGVENQMETPVAKLDVFPNPSEGNSVIAFSLNKKQEVSLSISDISGREIPVFVNRELPAGEHRIEMPDHSPLAAGVYFVRLISPDNIDVVKFVKN